MVVLALLPAQWSACNTCKGQHICAKEMLAIHDRYGVATFGLSAYSFTNMKGTKNNKDMRLNVKVPGTEQPLNATGNGTTTAEENGATYDETCLNSKERHVPDALHIPSGVAHRWINIGTWNVRTLHEGSKLEQIRNECTRLKIDILGMAEVRWKNIGQIKTEGWTLYYSGGEKHIHGVGFLVSPKFRKSIIRIKPVNERIIMITIEAKPKNLNIIQIYMPTTKEEDEQILNMYKEIQILVNSIPKKERLIIMGDFNAKIGVNEQREACGKFGLNETNQRGEMFLDWMEDNKMIALNTCFQHRKSQRYTWVSPGGKHKNMIDYIAIRKRDMKECLDSRSLKSADCGSDHQMVWAKIKGQTWARKKKRKMFKQRNYTNLKENQTKYEEKLKKEMDKKEHNWDNFVKANMRVIEQICPPTEYAIKPWINNECLELIRKRRIEKMKNHGSDEYRELCRKVKKETRKARKKHLKQTAVEAEKAFRTNKTKKVYEMIRTLSKKKRLNPSIGIKDDDGNMIYETGKIKERWWQYCKELYTDERNITATDEILYENTEPEVLTTEIRHAIKRMKQNKAAGLDKLPAEAIQAGGETSVEIMKNIIDNVWNTGEWPDDWVVSEMITIPKVEGTQECSKHRTLSLISHASKILLEIIRSRISYYINPNIADEQFGFMPGKGTTDAILTLRNIIQKSVKKKEQEGKLYLVFIDYSKAFDSIYHDMLWNTLKEFGVPQHLIWLISKLYEKARGIVRVLDDHTDSFPFQKGARQGCLISTLLFLVVGEKIMRDVEIKMKEIYERIGITIGGNEIWNERYADDTTLIAEEKEVIEKMLNLVKEISLKYGLKINAAKTKAMLLNDTCELKIDGATIDNVESFNYLGSAVDMTGSSKKAIEIRIAMAKRTTSQLTNTWKSSDISLTLKKSLIKSLIWSVATYGSESWTIKKEEEKKVAALEMWIWRKVLGIRWTEMKTNEWVRNKIGIKEEEGLLAAIKKRKTAKYLHWKRRPNSIVLATIEGERPGKCRRGRRKTEWFDDIKRWTALDTRALMTLAVERQRPP